MRKVIKDTNMVPVTITDLTLESNIAEGKTNPPTTDAVAKAIAGGGGGGGGAEYVDVEALNTRFSSFEALSTEISNGASFIFYKTGSTSTQYFTPSTLKNGLLSCNESSLGRNASMLQMVADRLDIYTQNQSLRYLIESTSSYGFNPSTYISKARTYIPVGPHTAGELLTCSNGIGHYHFYKCILDYTQVGASSFPASDSTHWAPTTLGEELRIAVPVPTPSDAGKILAVNSSGLAYWATPDELGLANGEFG